MKSLAAVAQNHPDLLEIAAGFFDAGDVLVAPGDFEQRLGKHVRPSTARDIIDHDGQAASLSRSREMCAIIPLCVGLL